MGFPCLTADRLMTPTVRAQSAGGAACHEIGAGPNAAMIEGPNGIDVHVGGRVRSGRLMRDMSQSELAGRIALTPLQLQDYERGASRISAGVLAAISRALGLPAGYFLGGLTEVIGPWDVESELARPTAHNMQHPTGLACLPTVTRLASDAVGGSAFSLVLPLAANDDAPDAGPPDP